MIERRNFFKRALAFLGVASTGAASSLAESQRGPGDPTKENKALTADEYRLIERSNEAEQLEVCLAGVSTAAAGWISDPAKPGDWAWHPAYQDTLDLRRKFEAAVKFIADGTAVTHQIVLYPCGCSATGYSALLDSSGLPLYCPDHGDHEHPNGYRIDGSDPLKISGSNAIINDLHIPAA